MVLRRRPGRRNRSSGYAGVSVRPNLLADEDLPPWPRQKRSLEKRARLKAAGLALFGEKAFHKFIVCGGLGGIVSIFFLSFFRLLPYNF